MIDDGFEEKAKERKKQKLKMLAEKGLLKKNKRRKQSKEFSEEGKEVEALNIASFSSSD